MTKITPVIQYINNHIYDRNNEIVLYFLNLYIHSSLYRKKSLNKQPAFPDNIVTYYKPSICTKSGKHKTNILIIILNLAIPTTISIYKFKQFVKVKNKQLNLI